MSRKQSFEDLDKKLIQLQEEQEKLERLRKEMLMESYAVVGEAACGVFPELVGMKKKDLAVWFRNLAQAQEEIPADEIPEEDHVDEGDPQTYSGKFVGDMREDGSMK